MIEHVCGTIQFNVEGGLVHSDICFDGKPSVSERELLHACLDEWLDKQSAGDGDVFALGDHGAFYPDEWDIDRAASMIADEILALSGGMPGDGGAIKAVIRDGIEGLL